MATNKSTHPLKHLIPEPEVATTYVSRSIGGTVVTDADGTVVERRGGRADLNVLAYCLDRSAAERRIFAPRLVGPTGAGKTHVVRAFAASKGLPVVTLSGSDGFDPLTVFGRYVPDPKGGIVWQDSDVLTVIKDGGVLYLDEINFLTGAQTAVFHPLLDNRRGVSVFDLGNAWVPAHQNLLVVATYNDRYEGTKRLNAAFANRFQLPIEWGYDQNVELALTGSPTLVDFAGEVRTLAQQGAIRTELPTNALVEFSELAFDIDILFATEALLQRFEAVERPVIRERLEIEDLLSKILTEVSAFYEADEGADE